jgi:hypothetical protein
MVKCRPFYLLREFSAVIVTVVYIPPQDKKNNKLPHNELYEVINKQKKLYTEAAFLVAGNFNSVSVRHVMPNFHQHVSNTTRGNKVLDHCYSTHKQAYKASLVRHSANQFMTLYSCFLYTKQKRKQEVPVTRSIEKWSPESEIMLQDCFASADWNMLRDLEMHRRCCHHGEGLLLPQSNALG